MTMVRLTSKEVQELLQNRSRVAAFSGHRPGRLPGQGDNKEFVNHVAQGIQEAYQRGKRVFLNGAMQGFDILAAEQVIALKVQYGDILCVTVAPFRSDFFRRNQWTPEWKTRALEVFRFSDYGLSLCESYFPGVYYRCNEFLIDHAGELLCYWDGGSGGTAYTYHYAQRKIPIYNLAICKGTLVGAYTSPYSL